MIQPQCTHSVERIERREYKPSAGVRLLVEWRRCVHCKREASRQDRGPWRLTREPKP